MPVQVIAEQADRIEQAKSIAVAAVVFAVVLSAIAMILAAAYLSKTKRLEVKYLKLGSGNNEPDDS